MNHPPKNHPEAVAGRIWGVYIHVPWCKRRCPYCDFYFEVGEPQVGFAQRVLQSYRARRRAWPCEPPATVYFGGGTPSALSAEAIGAILSGLEFLEEGSGREVTLEANPEDLNPGVLAAIKSAGINRLSLGVQSFDDDTLRWLGRAHDGEKARQVLKDAHAAGFERISVDLIVGLPREKRSRLQADLQVIFENAVSHLSTYLLTIENNTPLHKWIKEGKRAAPDDDKQAETYRWLQGKLSGAGWGQYEISSWAKPGHESRHNRLYWAKGSYLGLGPGAHSMRFFTDGSVLREHQAPSVKTWWAEPTAVLIDDHLPPASAFVEAVAFGLRDMKAGVDLALLAKRHQAAVPDLRRWPLPSHVEKGWLEVKGHHLRLTPKGALFADAVARDWLAF